MKIGYYKVSDVGGASLVNGFVNKRGSKIKGIRLDNGRIKMDAVTLDEKLEISADFNDVLLDIESYQNYEFFQSSEIYINLRFKVDSYTMRVEKTPVEMTLDEIEKELGHKVLITNKPKVK